MTSDIKTHNKWLEQINWNNITEYEFFYHQHNILFLQHERLIHLLVMMLVTLLLSIFFIAALILSILTLYLLTTIFFVLDIFYIKHYYLLENTIQSWYRTSNKLEKIIYNKKTN